MLPQEIINCPQWVVWRMATTNEGKPTKLPYCARTGQLASVADPNSWTDYQTAVNAFNCGQFSGIGFVLSDNDPYCIIDLDDPKGDAEIAAKQQRIAEAFNSYSEVSPSGNGLHIIIKAQVPGGRKRNKIEIYSSLHYFTMTGNTFQDLPIVERQYYAEMLWRELDDTLHTQVEVVESPETYSDEQIYGFAREADNGEKFEKLWQGDFESMYGSQSEADFALINILGFYSRNVTQIRRMFRLSELGKRAKAKRDGYLNPMIKRSFDNQPPLIPLEQLLISTANELARKDAEKDKEAAATEVNANFAGPLFEKTEVVDWTVPPGLLGDIAQFIYAAAPRPVKEVALAASIALMAGICGRAYNISGTGLNQYMLLLAKTGIGKEAAASGIDKLLTKIKGAVPAAVDFLGPAEIASGQALIKYLDKHPCFLSIVGEFGIALQQMCSPMASPSQVHLRKTLLSLYNKSGNTDVQRGMIYSDKEQNIGNVKSPAFSILGESTPEMYYVNMDEANIAQGLLPRFTCIEYRGDRPPLNERHITAEPSPDLLKTLGELTAQCLMLQHHQRCIDIQLDAEAMKLSKDFDKTCDARINTSDMEVARQLWNRAHIKALKLAALIAIGINPYATLVTYEGLQWAINLVERDVNNILKQFETGKAGKDFSEMNQLNELSSLIGDYIHRPFLGFEKYKIDPQMHSQRVVPLCYLQRRLMQRGAFRNDRMGATNAIVRALKALCDEGSIRELRQMDCYKAFGKTAKCFVVLDVARFNP